MTARSSRAVVQFLCSTVIYGGGLSVAAITAVGRIELNEATPDWLVYIANWAKHDGQLWAVLLALAVAASNLISKHHGQPWLWEQIDAILAQLRDNILTDQCDGDEMHCHRVTLFKHEPFRWTPLPWRWNFNTWGKGRRPCSGWLVPVARTGFTRVDTDAVFFADKKSGITEGVAGVTWLRASEVDVRDLPALEGRPTSKDMRIYAERAFVDEEFVSARLEKGKGNPRSLMGFPVLVNEVPWGVVIVDSSRPDGIKPSAQIVVAQKIAQQLLAKLAKRV